MLRDYQRYATFQSVIKTLAGEAIIEQAPEKSEGNVFAFVEKQGRVAPIEIQTAFDLTEAELQSIIDSLQSKQLIRLTPVRNGKLIECTTNPFACDPETSICAV